MARRATPRPVFDQPHVITESNVVRHLWGDAESGYVGDEVLLSTQQLHALIFTLPPGGRFGHSADNRTVFAADEVRTGFLRFRLFGWGNDGSNALGFTRGVREDDGSANLLFALFDVDPEVDVDLNGSVELGGRGLFYELSRFHWAVKLLGVDHLPGL